MRRRDPLDPTTIVVLSLGALALLVTVVAWVAIVVLASLAAPTRGEPPPDVPSHARVELG